MKKRVAIGIAGASAVLIAGWRLVQQMTDRDEAVMDPVSVAPGMPAEPSKKKAETASGVTPKPAGKAPSAKASKAELYEIAQDLGIEGRSKMSKAELIKAIEAAG
ncbi:MAG: Rho termination factor N-terminal domain-containing protein [Thermoleophilia bacterium]|nr:Rho termination factor N-terminal domain-containing protein [Thermoleophilia bacterium]